MTSLNVPFGAIRTEHQEVEEVPCIVSLCMAFGFFVGATVLVLLRIQLALPANTFLDFNIYNSSHRCTRR